MQTDDDDDHGNAPAIPKLWEARFAAGDAIVASAVGNGPEAATRRETPTLKRTMLVAPARRPGTTRAVLSFAGNARTMLLPELMDRPDIHLISLRDPDRCFALTGIPDLAPDLDSCLAGLRRILAALGADEVFCFGPSAGGYPALRYGMALGARGVLALSAPTTLNLDNDPGATMARYPQLRRLYSKDRSLGIDLVPVYQALMPRPSVIAIYSPLHKRDAWLSERLRGVAGVELIAIPDVAGHRTLGWLSETGELKPYLKRLLALQPYRRSGAPAASPA